GGWAAGGAAAALFLPAVLPVLPGVLVEVLERHVAHLLVLALADELVLELVHVLDVVPDVVIPRLVPVGPLGGGGGRLGLERLRERRRDRGLGLLLAVAVLLLLLVAEALQQQP